MSFLNTSTVIRICLDTNVIITATVFSGKPQQILELAEEGKIRLVISAAILSEIRKVLSVKFSRDDTEIKRLVKSLADIGEVVYPKKKITEIKYSPDNRILECAVEGKTNYIVTGDKKHLLPLKKFRGIKIVTAKDFLQDLNLPKF